jgi:predicted TIM-barrel fold metal-dependent hydrolase
LLYAGTFAKYPDLKFIFAHTGGTVSDLAYRIAAYATRHKEIADRIPDGPIAELKKLYYDVANSTNPSTMAAIMNLVPTSQILFGSDYPYVQIPVTTGGMDRLNLPPQTAAAINRENALAILPRLRSIHG